FEALLFSDPEAFARGVGREQLSQALIQIAEQFESPEHINNSSMTAPSKRIEVLMNDYEKPLMGSLAALEVGLATMRAKCSLFDAWLMRLEVLAVVDRSTI